MAYDPYDRFRASTGCGHMIGTVGMAAICDKPAKYTVEDCPFNANGLACGVHARATERRHYTVLPIAKES